MLRRKFQDHCFGLCRLQNDGNFTVIQGIDTESGLKLLVLNLASLATQGVCAGAQPNAYIGNVGLTKGKNDGSKHDETGSRDITNVTFA